MGVAKLRLSGHSGGMTELTIRSPALTARIATRGAELQSLTDATGRELMWQGDPAVWAGRAPILFPVIGIINRAAIRVDGRSYPMAKHGLARGATFTTVAHGGDGVVLRLAADAATRDSYPFDFELDIGFEVAGATLAMTAVIHNRGEGPMPASFGFHPAFQRSGDRLRFAEVETGPVKRIDGSTRPNPIRGRDLVLDDALFTQDAIILERPASRRLDHGALAIEHDLPTLALWSKPGAGFLCIEPWAGIPEPPDFAGELAEKPGIMTIAPGDARRFTMRVTLAA